MVDSDAALLGDAEAEADAFFFVFFLRLVLLLGPASGDAASSALGPAGEEDALPSLADVASPAAGARGGLAESASLAGGRFCGGG